MRLKLPYIGNIPNMITNTGRIGIRYLSFFTDYCFYFSDRLKDRHVRIPRPAHIVHFTASGLFIKLIKRRNKVTGVDVVAYLLALIAVDRIGYSFPNAFYEIRGNPWSLAAECAGPVRHPPRKTPVARPKYLPYSCTMRSAAVLDTPKMLWVEVSILIVSSIPFQYRCVLGNSHRVFFNQREAYSGCHRILYWLR